MEQIQICIKFQISSTRLKSLLSRVDVGSVRSRPS